MKSEILQSEILDDGAPMPGEGPEEQAFRESGQYEFRGKKLEPFSYTRKTAAAAMGLKFWRLDPEDYDPGATVYNEIADDIGIVLWLMHQPAEICRKVRRVPSRFEEAKDAWCDAAGIIERGSIAIPAKDAFELFMRIVADIDASQYKPDLKDAPAKN